MVPIAAEARAGSPARSALLRPMVARQRAVVRPAETIASSYVATLRPVSKRIPGARPADRRRSSTSSLGATCGPRSALRTSIHATLRVSTIPPPTMAQLHARTGSSNDTTSNPGRAVTRRPGVVASLVTRPRDLSVLDGAWAVKSGRRVMTRTLRSSPRVRTMLSVVIERAFPSTVPGLLTRLVARAPDRSWLFYEGDSWTAADVADQVERAATGLAERGVNHGDRVAVMLGNRPETIFAWFAANRLGAVFVPINHALKRPEIAGALRLTRPKVVIASEHRPLVASAIDELDAALRPLLVSPGELALAGRGAPPVEVRPED